MTESELCDALADFYRKSEKGESSTAVHLFGIKYAAALQGKNIELICEAAGLTKSWGTEVRKGMRLARYVEIKS